VRPRIAFVSQFGQPGTYNPAMFTRTYGKDDEVLAIEALLESIGVLNQIDFIGVHAHRGEPLKGRLDDVDAVIIGGSFACVRDNYDWQRTILEWLPEWRKTGRPLMGICGGHQLMSVALGGVVDRNPSGVSVGSLPLHITEAGKKHYLFQGFDENALFLFANGDRVAVAPPGSTVLATRPSLPHAAIDHGRNWVSVQFHPEMTCDRMAMCWLEENPSYAALYTFVVGAERMIGNFLTGTGVLR
jgi:GMP synthase-like glutamine amidotransferase